MDVKLTWKPCPFCGSNDLDIKDENHFVGSDSCMHVGCTNCDTDMWLFNTDKYTYDEAVEMLNTKWNMRKGEKKGYENDK